MKSILVASTNEAAHKAIRDCLGPDYRVDAALEMKSCFELFQDNRYEFTFIDVMLLRESTDESDFNDYKKALRPFWCVFPAARIIVLSPHEMIRDAVSAVKSGASNYLTYPINPDEVRYVIESAYKYDRIQSELDYFRGKFWESDSLEIVKTNSPSMKEVFKKIRAVAPTRSTVLLIGETGTGKGVLAKLIHRHSTRKDRQFISVHCGAIPEALVESELFGHEKGAFTGAHRRKLGRFEIAQGGTIFLDEVGTIPVPAQIKLLQVLQERIFQRVGGEESIKCDVRIIAATNTNLKKMCDEGLFRTDLYYRLNVFPIEIPPLHERIEDIPLLAKVILRGLDQLYSKNIRDVHPQVVEAFRKYRWPGNIRELENLMERAYILETSPILTPESFPNELFTFDGPRARIQLNTSLPLYEVRRKGVENIERQYLKELLAVHKGRIKSAAQAAGISTRQLHKLLSKYGIRKEEFKLVSCGTQEPES